MEPLFCYILKLFSRGSVEHMWPTTKGLFYSIKRKAFNRCSDSRLRWSCQNIFVSNPWLLYSFSLSLLFLSPSLSCLNRCLYAEPVLASPYTFSLPPPTTTPPPSFTTSLWPWEEYRSSEGNKCVPVAGWEDWGRCRVLSLCLTLSLPVCLLLGQENQRRSVPLQPWLRGVWLQRKESEEVGCGPYSSDGSKSESNTENTRWM